MNEMWQVYSVSRKNEKKAVMNKFYSFIEVLNAET